MDPTSVSNAKRLASECAEKQKNHEPGIKQVGHIGHAPQRSRVYKESAVIVPPFTDFTSLQAKKSH